jgi:hypothetical protein
MLACNYIDVELMQCDDFYRVAWWWLRKAEILQQLNINCDFNDILWILNVIISGILK